jgi:hypothetical protein
VHDELGVSVPRTRAGVEAFHEMHHVMETCIELRVPIKADPALAENWAAAERDDNKIRDWRKAHDRVTDAAHAQAQL